MIRFGVGSHHPFVLHGLGNQIGGGGLTGGTGPTAHARKLLLKLKIWGRI